MKWEPLVAATPSSPEVPAAPSPQSAKAEASAKESSKADGSESRTERSVLGNAALTDKLLSKNAWEKEQARRLFIVADETVDQLKARASDNILLDHVRVSLSQAAPRHGFHIGPLSGLSNAKQVERCELSYRGRSSSSASHGPS